MKHIHMFLKYWFCLCICIIYYCFYFVVDSLCNIFTVVSACASKIPTYKHFILISIIYHADIFWKSVFRNHRLSCTCRLFYILWCTCCDVIKYKRLRNSSSKTCNDVLLHLSLCHKSLITLRKRHCIACCPWAGRYYGYHVNRSHIRKYMEKYSMTCLMVSRNLLVFLWDYLTLLFLAYAYLYKWFAYIFLFNELSALFCTDDSRLVQKIFKVSTRKTYCSACNLLKVNIIAKRLALCMNLQDFFSSSYIRSADSNFSVKSSRS